MVYRPCLQTEIHIQGAKIAANAESVDWIALTWHVMDGRNISSNHGWKNCSENEDIDSKNEDHPEFGVLIIQFRKKKQVQPLAKLCLIEKHR